MKKNDRGNDERIEKTRDGRRLEHREDETMRANILCLGSLNVNTTFKPLLLYTLN